MGSVGVGLIAVPLALTAGVPEAAAVNGDTPKKRTSIGVISAPPPTPVNPTTKPVNAPASAYAVSIMLESKPYRG